MSSFQGSRESLCAVGAILREERKACLPSTAPDRGCNSAILLGPRPRRSLQPERSCQPLARVPSPFLDHEKSALSHSLRDAAEFLPDTLPKRRSGTRFREQARASRAPAARDKASRELRVRKHVEGASCRAFYSGISYLIFLNGSNFVRMRAVIAVTAATAPRDACHSAIRQLMDGAQRGSRDRSSATGRPNSFRSNAQAGEPLTQLGLAYISYCDRLKR